MQVRVRIHIAGRLEQVGEFGPFKEMTLQDYGPEMDCSCLETEGYIEGMVDEKELHYTSGLVNSPAVDRVELMSDKRSLVSRFKDWIGRQQ